MRRQNKELASELAAAQVDVRRLKISRWNSIAWEQQPGAAPLGVRIAKPAPPIPATGGPSTPATGGPSTPATGGPPRTPLKSRIASPIVSEPKRSRGGGHLLRRGMASEHRGSKPATGGPVSPATGGHVGTDRVSAAGKAQCKAECKRRLDQAESRLQQLLAVRAGLPCTRLQWAAWVSANLGEFQTRMRKTEASHRRRELNNRVFPRPGLPRKAARIQASVEVVRVTMEWAKLLEWRTGWFGLQADSGRRMFYLLRLRQTTYVIDLESERVPDATFPYHLSKYFKITESMKPLGMFERTFSEEVVHAVYEFGVASHAEEHTGVCLRPVTAPRITEAIPYKAPRVKSPDDGDGGVEEEDAEADDSCEDLGDVPVPSDLEDETLVVGTSKEMSSDDSGVSFSDAATSTDSDEGSESSGLKVDLKKGKPATGGHEPATGSHQPATGGHKGHGGPIIFDNKYFKMHSNKLDLKMHIHDRWLISPPEGLGTKPTMTKTITPSTLGEPRDSPQRTMICLRAWMLWRVRAVPGWLEANACRQRLFMEATEELYAEAARIRPQADGLLGHPLASKLFREFVPDLVVRLSSGDATT